MHSIVYMSTAQSAFSEASLIKLLEISRQNNKKSKITGLLLYKGGSFIGVIEGRKSNAEALYTKIIADSLHHNIITLISSRVAVRAFSDWKMGFETLNSSTKQVAGFSNFLQQKETLCLLGKTDVMTLLISFRDSFR